MGEVNAKNKFQRYIFRTSNCVQFYIIISLFIATFYANVKFNFMNYYKRGCFKLAKDRVVKQNLLAQSDVTITIISFTVCKTSES